MLTAMFHVRQLVFQDILSIAAENVCFFLGFAVTQSGTANRSCVPEVILANLRNRKRKERGDTNLFQPVSFASPMPMPCRKTLSIVELSPQVLYRACK